MAVGLVGPFQFQGLAHLLRMHTVFQPEKCVLRHTLGMRAELFSDAGLDNGHRLTWPPSGNVAPESAACNAESAALDSLGVKAWILLVAGPLFIVSNAALNL